MYNYRFHTSKNNKKKFTWFDWVLSARLIITATTTSTTTVSVVANDTNFYGVILPIEITNGLCFRLINILRKLNFATRTISNIKMFPTVDLMLRVKFNFILLVNLWRVELIRCGHLCQTFKFHNHSKLLIREI